MHRQENGQVCLEVVGINAFNPTKGIIEAGSARTIMGAMVDNPYDTESFRARLINVKQVNRNQRTLNPNPPKRCTLELTPGLMGKGGRTGQARFQ